MGEMIERVATAIQQAPTYGMRRNKEALVACEYEIFLRDDQGGDIKLVEAYDDYEVAAIRTDILNDESRARAAIEEMRDPSRKMLDAAHRNNHPRDIDTWQTMIDEALKP